MEDYMDGEVIGKDTDGCLMLWDAITKSGYNCGETLDEFGVQNLSRREKKRLGI